MKLLNTVIQKPVMVQVHTNRAGQENSLEGKINIKLQQVTDLQQCASL